MRIGRPRPQKAKIYDVKTRWLDDGQLEFRVEVSEKMAAHLKQEAALYGITPDEFLHRLLIADCERSEAVTKAVLGKPITQQTINDIRAAWDEIEERLFPVQH